MMNKEEIAEYFNIDVSYLLPYSIAYAESFCGWSWGCLLIILEDNLGNYYKVEDSSGSESESATIFNMEKISEDEAIKEMIKFDKLDENDM